MTSAAEREGGELAAQEKRSHEAAVLLEIAQAAGSTLELAEVLRRVVERTASLTGADRCSIWLLDDSRERLLPAALFGMDPGFTARWKGRILALKDERLSQEVVATGKPVVVPDAETDPRTDKPAVALFRDKSILVVPLLSKGRVIGTLFLNHVKRPYAYTDEDVAITMAIASQAAVAIENAQLYEESRRQSEELLASFRRIGEALSAGLDISETLEIIVNLATEMVHADIGSLELVGDDGELSVKATRGIRIEEAHRRVALHGDRLGEAVLRSGQPLCVPDLRAEAGEYAGNPFGSEMGTYLGVPLYLRGEVRGVLAVYNRRPGRFTPTETAVLASFANQAAVAIDNARLFSTLQRQVSELSEAMAQNAALYASLQAEKDRVDAIFRNSSDAIYMVDSQLRILAFNPAAEQLTGWREAEAIGAPCSEVVRCVHCDYSHPQVACSSTCPMRKVLASRESLPYQELTIVTRSGQTKDLAASFSYMPASNDSGPCGVAIVRDISQIREVDRLKSEFVSMVSHDLRTPLAVIKGYAATLLNPLLKLDEERQRRFIKGINDASDRLTRLIDNILSVSRLESGRFKLNPQTFDLSEVVLRVAQSFRSSSGKHQIVVNLPGDSLRIRADRDQIEQVLTNLLGNAVKYSPEGGEIAVTVRVGDGEIGIEVSDQGIGIPRSQISRVFEKYYRGDEAVARRVSGTGLGLYICKSIVEAHGGRIWVESEPGHGSTFHISLPTGVRPLPAEPVDAHGRTGATALEDGDELLGEPEPVTGPAHSTGQE